MLQSARSDRYLIGMPSLALCSGHCAQILILSNQPAAGFCQWLLKLFVDCQIHAVDAAHCQAEKEASSWQKKLEHSQVQHQKQVNEVKVRCSAFQAERNALTMALSAIAAELVRIMFQANSSAPTIACRGTYSCNSGYNGLLGSSVQGLPGS